MIEFFLAEKIYNFVKTVQMVKRSQIYVFFRKYDKSEVAHVLDQLISESYLHQHDEERISNVQYIHTPLSEYDSVIDAVEVLCRLPENEVVWISRDEYPFDICFGTISGSVYSVTSYTNNWQIKYALTPAARKKYTPFGEEDIVKYVAVVRDMDVMIAISKLEFYNFNLINPDGSIDTYDPPES